MLVSLVRFQLLPQEKTLRFILRVFLVSQETIWMTIGADLFASLAEFVDMIRLYVPRSGNRDWE